MAARAVGVGPTTPALPLRIFRVGIEYLIQHDDRVLLDLITTERRILQQALGLEPADSDAR